MLTQHLLLQPLHNKSLVKHSFYCEGVAGNATHLSQQLALTLTLKGSRSPTVTARQEIQTPRGRPSEAIRVTDWIWSESPFSPSSETTRAFTLLMCT